MTPINRFMKKWWLHRINSILQKWTGIWIPHWKKHTPPIAAYCQGRKWGLHVREVGRQPSTALRDVNLQGASGLGNNQFKRRFFETTQKFVEKSFIATQMPTVFSWKFHGRRPLCLGHGFFDGLVVFCEDVHSNIEWSQALQRVGCVQRDDAKIADGGEWIIDQLGIDLRDAEVVASDSLGRGDHGDFGQCGVPTLLPGQGVCEFVEHPFGISAELFAELEFDWTLVEIRQKPMPEQLLLWNLRGVQVGHWCLFERYW